MGLNPPNMDECSPKQRCLSGINEGLAYSPSQPCVNGTFSSTSCDCEIDYACGSYTYQVFRVSEWSNLYQTNQSCGPKSLQLPAGTDEYVVSSGTITACGVRLVNTATSVDGRACCYPNVTATPFVIGVLQRRSVLNGDWIFIRSFVEDISPCGCCVYRFGTVRIYVYLKLFFNGALFYDGSKEIPPQNIVGFE